MPKINLERILRTQTTQVHCYFLATSLLGPKLQQINPITICVSQCARSSTTTLPTTTLDTTFFPDGNRGTTVDFFGDFTSTTPLPTTSFSQTLETRTTSTFPLATAFTGEFQTTSTFPLATAFTLPEGLKGIGAAPQTKGFKTKKNIKKKEQILLSTYANLPKMIKKIDQ